MLFALTFDDRSTFDLIYQWTRANLKRPTDALHIWRWLPDRTDHTPDHNNATDGDLVIAMALLRAAALWDLPAYQQEALAIAEAIRNKLVVSNRRQLILLPGLHGFAGSQSLTMNLSYYNFVVMRALAEIDPSSVWQRLITNGEALIEGARFGRWMLPPDWLSVARGSGSLGIASGWPPLFSYDAIRVPLNLVWARALTPSIAAGFDAFWTNAASYQPAWANLRTNAVSPYAASGGFVAVKRITSAIANGSALGSLPAVATCADYYSAALTILARIAWMESQAA
jgi:endoglucanase